MIYLDNSATTLKKPATVACAVADAIGALGNAGRSVCSPALNASRMVFSTRLEVAKLVRLGSPMGVAFTSGATESLNLVLNSLIRSNDHVVTSVLEHNSVLRPLYKIGCSLSFIPCDEQGRLVFDNLTGLLRKNTRFVVCTHGSNLTGSVTDLRRLQAFCKQNGLGLILDVSQTLGCIETYADMADVLCFTGHKALFGPQGTGGIITDAHKEFSLVKTGGSGSNSFDPHQALSMPDIFEAGTHNAHGLAGLQAGVRFINETGIDVIMARERMLVGDFLTGLRSIPGLRLYGPELVDGEPRLPVISLNMADLSAADLSFLLWDGWKIATRAGSHCAPLAHEFFGTRERGMVRFSPNFFTTEAEIAAAVSALRSIADSVA